MEKPFYDRAVEKLKTLEGTASVKLKGLNLTEFKLRFGQSPQDIGLKLRDLVFPSMNNTKFKGILVKDDGSMGALGVDYEFAMKLTLQDTETFLDARNNIHQGQADKVVTYLSSPSMAEDQLWKDLRNCNHTVRRYELQDLLTLRFAAESITSHSCTHVAGRYVSIQVTNCNRQRTCAYSRWSKIGRSP